MFRNTILIPAIFVAALLFCSTALLAQVHKAPHGGVLSEIEACGIGHVEMVINGDQMVLWFLDEGHNVDRTVPIIEERIPLSIITDKGKRIELQAIASPMKLAGEKLGRCSHFVAQVEGLSELKNFECYGWVRFKGETRPLYMRFPEGVSSHEHSDEEDSCCEHEHEHDHLHQHEHK